MAEAGIELKRVYPVDIDRVFEAWTDPGVMSSWFYVGDRWTAEVENDLRVGGTYRISMRTEGGETLVCHGIYREVSRPHRLAFTWNSHLHSGSLVTIELRPVAEGTELTLTHSGLPTEELRTAHYQGWIGCLTNFDRAAAKDFATN
jgi:uncharacterized protein YndB with AHSA1/START domain